MVTSRGRNSVLKLLSDARYQQLKCKIWINQHSLCHTFAKHREKETDFWQHKNTTFQDAFRSMKVAGSAKKGKHMKLTEVNPGVV